MKTYLRNVMACLAQENAFKSSDWYENVIRKCLTNAFDYSLLDFVSEEYFRALMDNDFCVAEALEDVFTEALEILANVACKDTAIEDNYLEMRYQKLLELEASAKKLHGWQISKRISLNRQIGYHALIDFGEVMLILRVGYVKNINDDPQTFYFFANEVASNWLNSMKANF